MLTIICVDTYAPTDVVNLLLNGSEGWGGLVFRADDIVFDDYEKYFHSLLCSKSLIPTYDLGFHL